MSCSYISATQIFFVKLRYVKYILTNQDSVQALSLKDYLNLNTKSKFQTKSSHNWDIKYLVGYTFDQKLGVFIY